MTPERAVELVKWNHCYAKPKPKNDKEVMEAIQFVKAHPELWNEITWSAPKTA